MCKKIIVQLTVVVLLVLVLAVMFVFIDTKNEPNDGEIKISVLVEPSLDYVTVSTFSEGMAIVRIGSKNPKYGFIDKYGEVVIPCEYDYAFRFNEGMAAVSKKGNYGFIDKIGNEVIPPEYEYAICFANGLAAVRKDGKFGFINTSGKTVIAFEYDQAVNFFYEVTTVKKDNKFGIIDIKGNIVAPFEYDNIYIDYDNGFFNTEKDGKRGLINMSGDLIVPCVYDRIVLSSGTDGLITVRQNGKWGILQIKNFIPKPRITPINDERFISWDW